MKVTPSIENRRSFRSNIIINAAFSVLPILAAIASVPIYLKLIGLERYGILSFVWLVSGMFSLFNLGLGQATNFRVARAREGISTGVRPVSDSVITALLFNLGLGVVAGVLFFVFIGPVVFGGIKLDEAMQAEINASLPFIASLLPVALVTAVLRGAIDGQAAFITGNSIQVGGQIAGTIATLGVAYFISPALPGLILSILIVRLSIAVAYGFANHRLLVSGRVLQIHETLEMLRFGGWNSLFASLSLILISVDRFIVGWTLGASALAIYAVPYSVVQRSQFLRDPLLRTLFPKLSGTADATVRRVLTSRMLRATMGVTGVISIPLLVAARDLLAVWIDPEFAAQATGVTKTLIFAFWIFASLQTLLVFEIASGRPGIPARLRLASALPFLFIINSFTVSFGLLGTAASLAVWWGAELAIMLARNRMVREVATQIIAWAVLWTLGYAATLLQLSMFENLSLAVAFGGCSLLLSLSQSPDLRRIATLPQMLIKSRFA